MLPLPKTEDTDVTIEKIKEKSKQELFIGDTKKRVSKVFRGLEKTPLKGTR